MSDRPPARINPWSVWALIAIMLGGLLVYYSWIKNVERQLAEGRPPRLRVVDIMPVIDHTGTKDVLFDNDGMFYLVGYFYAGDPEQAKKVCDRMEKVYETVNDPRLVLLGVTVAPDLDTPESLSAFAAAQGYTGDQWKFVTGDPQTLPNYMNKNFRYAHLPKPEKERKRPTDLFAWELRITLVDPKRDVRGVYWEGDPRGELRNDSRCAPDVLYLFNEQEKATAKASGKAAGKAPPANS